MSTNRIIGVEFDNWPPERGDMHFNDGGWEHLRESDYVQAAAYGREIGRVFRVSEITLADTLNVVSGALMEDGLDLEPAVKQTAFFRGIVDVAYVVPQQEGAAV